MKRIYSLLLITVSLRLSLGADSVAVTPQDSLISLGTSFSLTCTLSPVVTDHSNVRWTLERASDPTNSQVTLTNSGRFTISTRTDSEAGQTVSVLTISEVETDDSGEYYCSDQTDMNQNQATLTVYTAPRVELISDPAVPIVDKVKNITLHCATSNAEPVTWAKNGEVIDGEGLLDLDGDEDMDVEIKTNNTLVILNSELTDTGVYECIVSHQVGGKTVEERHPKEVTAPLMIKLPQSVNLEEGENARILCEVSSFPPPMVTWYRGNEMLSNGSNDGRTWVIETPPGSPQVMSTLMIKKVVDADRDVYTCNATNSANEKDSKECLLRVKDRLAALWPFIGIMCEVIVLVAIILLCERRQKSKMMNDDVDDIPEAKKLNDNSNTNESDIRLRNINA